MSNRSIKTRLSALSELDGRTVAAKEAREIARGIATDVGGDPTTAQQVLIEQSACRSALCGAELCSAASMTPVAQFGTYGNVPYVQDQSKFDGLISGGFARGRFRNQRSARGQNAKNSTSAMLHYADLDDACGYFSGGHATSACG